MQHACVCAACSKPFVRHRTRGNMARCTPCQKKERAALWKRAHPERARAINAKSRAANRESDRASKRKWQIANREAEASKQAKRRASKMTATPVWADDDRTKSIYALARVWADFLGEEIHVDHIVPLQGKSVCGLHWHENLQLLTGEQNRAKSNRMEGNP